MHLSLSTLQLVELLGNMVMEIDTPSTSVGLWLLVVGFLVPGLNFCSLKIYYFHLHLAGPVYDTIMQANNPFLGI